MIEREGESGRREEMEELDKEKSDNRT